MKTAVENNIIGKIARIINNIVPTIVTRDNVCLTYSSVSAPGLTPGIYPPFFFKLSATSSGLSCKNV